MSQNRDDKPKTARGKDPITGQPFNHATNKPAKGELFVRRRGGDVLLHQTNQLNGIRPQDDKAGSSTGIGGKVFKFLRKTR